MDLRLCGDPADIAALLGLFAAAGVELTGTGRPYANARGAGVRVYTQVRPGPATDPVAQDPGGERQ